jgi:hypothetical protein
VQTKEFNMAGSNRPGSLTPPAGSCKVPAKTPGLLGVNDRGDPNITSLMGDTPGSLGVCDWADPTLPLFSPADPYAALACFGPDNVPIAAGPDLQTPTNNTSQAGTITVDKAEEIALAISTYFEGGKSMNYRALAGDFDGMGTSFGLIQWNFGQGTLGPLLKKMMDANSAAFAACFGAEADFDTLKKALTDGNKDAQLKWARALLKSHQSAWKMAFDKIGSNDEFNKIQRKEAAGEYHPLAVDAIRTIRSFSASLLAQVELRSYAALYDLCVQQHGIKNAVGAIKNRIKLEKPSTQIELMKIVVTERGLKANHKWVSDCISRRMGILTGAPFQSEEHQIVAKRKNPQFSLIAQFGNQYVSGL